MREMLVTVLIVSAMAGVQAPTIAGVVRDPQQAVIAGAEVTLVNQRTGTADKTLTDSGGAYRFESPASGTYVVQVRAAGFREAASDRVVLDADQHVTRDFVLTLAGATESVTVSGAVTRAYSVEDAPAVGSSAPVRLLDAPMTLTILPGELIANAQVRSFKEATRFLPLVEFQEMQGSEVMRPETRGMQGSNMQNTRMDGMGIVITGANNLESVQQIEVLNGLGGASYGPANPSGMFNFVPKRPTEQARRRLAIGYDGRAAGTIHGDIGGRLGPKRTFGPPGHGLARGRGGVVEETR